MNKKAEIVVVATPAFGNFVPAVEFAQRLIHRDHRLSATVLVIPIPHRPQVNAHIDSSASATARLRFLRLPPVDPPSPDQCQTEVGFLSLLIEKHKPHAKHVISKLISTESDSQPNSVSLAGLFVDMFCTPMMDVAGELGVPSFLFFTSPAAFLGFILHLPTLPTTEFRESGTELSIPSFKNPVPTRVFPASVLNRSQDGFARYLYHTRRYRQAKGIVVNTFLELEPYALKSLSAGGLPPVYSVGPVLDLRGQPAKGDLHEYSKNESIEEWLDRQPTSSVVFLCFGSMGSLSVGQVREIAEGLKRTGYRFLWSLRQPAESTLGLPNDYVNLREILPDGFLDRTAEIGLVCGWVPQVTVLAHKAIGGFVSHCGWNSILESLWFGVPIATWPVYAEQQMNAFMMVKELGLAAEIKLDYRGGSDLVLAEQVERAVRELMDGDGAVRRKTKEMSEKSRIAVDENGSSDKFLGQLIEKLMAEI